VPFDGSEASEAALTYASHIPCNEIVLLHVAVDDEILVPEWSLEWEDDDTGEASVRSAMERLASRFRTDERNVLVEVRVGDVAEEVIDAGEDADLIVMMTHGRGAAGRLIFGSVADRVVRHGHTRTLLLRIGDLTRSPQAPKRIAVALDGSHLAEQSLPAAEAMARRLNLPLVLMRAVGWDEIKLALRKHRPTERAPYEQSPTLFEDTKQSVIAEAEGYLAAHADRLRDAGIHVETQVLDGTAAFSLMWALTPEDILILTTRGRSGFKRWSIGSVAEKLVREAPCPVMLQRVHEER
jgi:nucleotide-binding universal stress UspA family protein